MTVAPVAQSDEPKRSNYGALKSTEETVADDVDSAYCTEYSLPETPTVTDYLLYPYRSFQKCSCVHNYPFLVVSDFVTMATAGQQNILRREYATTLGWNSPS